MSKPTIHSRQRAVRVLALVALTSLAGLAGHAGGRPALSDGGNRVIASKPAGRLAGKTASATTQESIRILKQRGEYESLRAAVEKSRYGLREQKSTSVSGSASGYIASNQAQNFRTEFTKTGVQVAAAFGRPTRLAVGAAPDGLWLRRGVAAAGEDRDVFCRQSRGVSLLCHPSLDGEGKNGFGSALGRGWERARRADRVVCERCARD